MDSVKGTFLWTQLQVLIFLQNPPGIFVHPSGAEFSLSDVGNKIKSCYGDKQGKEFRFWVDQVLSSPIGSDQWLTKFYKWEQSGNSSLSQLSQSIIYRMCFVKLLTWWWNLAGEERRGCATTCIVSLKVTTFSFEIVANHCELVCMY